MTLKHLGRGFVFALLSTAPIEAVGPEPDHGVNPRIWHVDCGRGDTISSVLERVKPGDTVSVRGVCVENVEIREGMHRLVLDGNGTATIIAADRLVDAVRI